LNQNAIVTEIATKEKKFDPLANPFDSSAPILTSPKPFVVKDRKIAVPLVTDQNPLAWVTVDSPLIPETIKKTKLFRRATLLVSGFESTTGFVFVKVGSFIRSKCLPSNSQKWFTAVCCKLLVRDTIPKQMC